MWNLEALFHGIHEVALRQTGNKQTLPHEVVVWVGAGGNQEGGVLSQRRHLCGKQRKQALFFPSPPPRFPPSPLPLKQYCVNLLRLTLECVKTLTEYKYRMINQSVFRSQRLRIWPEILCTRRAIARRVIQGVM